MPSKYGKIANAFIFQDSRISSQNDIANPLALNLYLLGYDSNNNLAHLNNIVKNNVKKYLEEYRLLTDAINIRNAHIINIGLKISIVTFQTYNKNEVILNCINMLKDYFNITKWQINQPIIIAEIVNELLKIEGVQNVNNIVVDNK